MALVQALRRQEHLLDEKAAALQLFGRIRAEV
jgi:hypothetical protein